MLLFEGAQTNVFHTLKFVQAPECNAVCLGSTERPSLAHIFVLESNS